MASNDEICEPNPSDDGWVIPRRPRTRSPWCSAGSDGGGGESLVVVQGKRKAQSFSPSCPPVVPSVESAEKAPVADATTPAVNKFKSGQLKSAMDNTAESMMDNTRILPAMDNTAESMMDNTKIDGAPPFRSSGKQYWIRYSDEPDPQVSETKFASCLQLDIKPKPKPDIFVNYRDSYRSGDLDLRSDGDLDLRSGGYLDLDDYFVAYSLEEDGTLSPKYFIFIPTFLAEIDYYFTGASCNGLFHFYDEESGSQALWNPTTGGYKVLPKPFVESDPLISYWFESYGMWYDHTFKDYKVLNLVAAYSEDDVLAESYHIDLYSLKYNSWKRIPCPDFECADRSSGACVAGVFYCEASLKQTPVILSFDFSTETLFSLPVPLPSPENMCDQYIFREYKGLLSALACWHAEDEDIQYPDVPRTCELWIMSDGSWTRESVFNTRGVETPLWFSQDGKLLYFASSIAELVVFDRATGELKRLGIDWSSAHERSEPMMIPFYESFVQLN